MTVALILCGGSGRRIGGHNKPLMTLAGISLIERVVTRLAPQVDDIVISANRDLRAYERLGYAVVPDQSDHLEGPLAGVYAGLRHLQSVGRDDHVRVQLCPGDTPFLPSDLVRRLQQHGTSVPFDGTQTHHLHSQMTMSRALLALEAAQDQPAVYRWLERQNAQPVDFTDAAADFHNINTNEQLTAARQRLES